MSKAYTKRRESQPPNYAITARLKLLSKDIVTMHYYNRFEDNLR